MAKGAQREKEKAPPVDHRGPLRVGRYLIVSRLGRGGMGMVYRGLDETLEREVAVKTLTAEGTLDDENRARFEIEAKAAAKLQHPNIVTVYELGEDRGIPYIAMEILPGSDLETLVRSGESIPLAERLDILIQTCRGLAFAHEHKVVHRDIKPSNIRLLDDGVVKIMDFGIAKLGGTNVTKSGMMVGTMNYMSPEQIRGLPLDGRSDVFSVGVMLFQLLAGRRPFVGSGGPDVLYRIVQDPTPPLGVDLGSQTARLQEIVEKALAKEPEARYATAAQLADDLQRLLPKIAPPPVLTAAQQEAITQSRRALRAGRLDEALRNVESLLAEQPDTIEARRVVRAIRREQQRRAQPAEGETELFPELEATYRAQATQRSSETKTAERPAGAAPPAPVADAAKGLLVAGGVLLAGALLIGGLLLVRGSKPQPVAPPEPTVTPTAKATGPAAATTPGPVGVTTPKPVLKPLSKPALVKLKVETDPAGAALALDGAKLGVSPAEIEIDPAKAQKLQATMEGYTTQEVVLAAGQTPPALHLTLEASGPPGSLAVASSYPVDVVWRGRVLAKAQVAPRVSLPPGRHAVTILAPGTFLKKEAVVDVKSGGTLSIDTPAVGKISIKANPDNCEVFIDGVFVDYPPILDRAIVEGAHIVSFKWPDGVKRDEEKLVKAGQISYVMGRRD